MRGRAPDPAGRLRALAVTTSRRWGELPEVPTLSEAGVPGYEATLWLNLMAPAGVAQELAAFMRAEYDKWGKVVRDTGATVN